jgi:hypothetical protein
MLKDILRLLVTLFLLTPGPSFGQEPAPPSSDAAAAWTRQTLDSTPQAPGEVAVSSQLALESDK